MSPSVSRERLRRLLEPVVAEAGLELEDVVILPAGRRRVVQVLVDRDGGADLDEIAQVSATVSAWLDTQDVLPLEAYVLEVSTPGVDRPLTTPRQWARARRRMVEVGVTGMGTVRGRVLATDESRVTLRVGDDVLDIDRARLGPGHVQVEFSPPREEDTSEH
ncbi:MAG: ribosome maturation factor RimP [Actinomycetes bacterium]